MSNEKPQTHVVTKPNSRALTPIDQLGLSMKADFMVKAKNYFNGNKDEAMRFLSSAIDYCRRVPKLLDCDRTSLMVAFVQAAQMKLMPSGIGGELYIIPYGSEAKLQMGYQGIVTLLYRTEKLSALHAQIIYANDEFSYEEGLEPKLHHKPAMFGKAKGDPIGVYAVAQMKDGARTFKVMDKEAIMAIRNMSKAKNSKESPWNSDKDPELWMWKKTCLIQLAKLLPKTQDIQKAVEIDYEGEGMEKTRLDAGGPAVAPANHRPEETEKKPKVESDDIPIIEETPGQTTHG